MYCCVHFRCQLTVWFGQEILRLWSNCDSHRNSLWGNIDRIYWLWDLKSVGAICQDGEMEKCIVCPRLPLGNHSGYFLFTMKNEDEKAFWHEVTLLTVAPKVKPFILCAVRNVWTVYWTHTTSVSFTPDLETVWHGHVQLFFSPLLFCLN